MEWWESWCELLGSYLGQGAREGEERIRSPSLPPGEKICSGSVDVPGGGIRMPTTGRTKVFLDFLHLGIRKLAKKNRVAPV